MKGKWLVAGAAVILAAVAGGALSLLRQNEPLKPQPAPRASQPASAEYIHLPGRLQAKRVISIAAPLEGVIEAFHVEVGADVYEGQLLAQVRSEGLEATRLTAQQDLETARGRINNLEASIAAARLEASRAAADAARARGEFDRAARMLERQKILISEGATPRNTFEKAQKDYAQAEKESKNLDAVSQQADARISSMQRELDTARKLLEGKEADLEHAEGQIARGEIHSPVDGVLSARHGQPGDHVDPSLKDLFQIATDLSSMEAVGDADPAQIPHIQAGQPAGVIIAEAPNEVLPATVTSVENGRVVVEFANPNPAIKPGLTAQIRLKTGG